MAKAEASQQAVDFSRKLYSQKGGEFGVMWSFQALGPIDMAKVSYPLREVGYPNAVGARSEALLLVNGNPPILDVDELTKLDKSALEQYPSYRALKQRYPNLELWGAGRGGTMWEPVREQPDGGQSFDAIYFLNPGPPAGAVVKRCSFLVELRRQGKISGNNFRCRRGPTSRLNLQALRADR